MKNIAIKGHFTRGKEIIKILENLCNIKSYLEGTLINKYYYIKGSNVIIASFKGEEDLIGFKLYESLEEYENSNKTINYTEI